MKAGYEQAMSKILELRMKSREWGIEKGRKDVVEWINTNIADPFPYAKEEWQAKLKEWGLDKA